MFRGVSPTPKCSKTHKVGEVLGVKEFPQNLDCGGNTCSSKGSREK